MNYTAKITFFSICAITGLIMAIIGFIFSNTGNIFVAPFLFIIGLLMLTVSTVALTMLRQKPDYETIANTDLSLAYGSAL